MNSENSKLFDPHRLLLNLSNKIDFYVCDMYVALSNRSMYYTWDNIISHTQTIYLKQQLQRGMKSLTYLMDHSLYQTLKTVLIMSSKNIEKLLIFFR